MEISLNKSYGNIEVIFESENTRVTEDIADRIYEKDAYGKSVLKSKDVGTIQLESILCFVEDLVYERKREFDGSKLIERLFEKLPPEWQGHLLEKLTTEHRGEVWAEVDTQEEKKLPTLEELIKEAKSKMASIKTVCTMWNEPDVEITTYTIGTVTDYTEKGAIAAYVGQRVRELL